MSNRRSSVLVLATIVFILYLVTLSRHYTADGLLYALTIERGRAIQLLDPTHVLLHPLGWAWYQGWLLFGWGQGSIVPLQLLNALGGALAVGLLYATIHRLTQSMMIARLVAAGFSVSGGLWLLSVEAEFVTIPLASQLLVIWLLLAPSQELAIRPAYPILLGLAVALATLVYLSSLFLVPVVIVGLFWKREDHSGRRRRFVVIFIVTTAIILFTAGLGVMAAWTAGDWSRLVELGGHGRYGRWSWQNIIQGIYAFLRTLVLYRDLAMNDSTLVFLNEATGRQRTFFIIYYGLVLVLALLPIAGAFKVWKKLRHSYFRELAILAVWSVCFGAFSFFWVPGDISFWVPLLAAWWLLTALVMSCLQREQARHWILASGFLIFLLALFNSTMVILPRRDLTTNWAYHLASKVASQTEPKDVIIADDQDISILSLAYFGNRLVIPVSGLAQDMDKALADVRQSPAITQACQSGAGIFLLLSEALQPSELCNR